MYPVLDLGKMQDPVGVVWSLILAQTLHDRGTHLRLTAGGKSELALAYQVEGRWHKMSDPSTDARDRRTKEAMTFARFSERLARAVGPRRRCLRAGDVVEVLPLQQSRWALYARELGADLETALGPGGQWQVAEHEPGKRLLLAPVQTWYFTLVELRIGTRTLGYEFECFACGAKVIHDAKKPELPTRWRRLSLSGVPHDFCLHCSHQLRYEDGAEHPTFASPYIMRLLKGRDEVADAAVPPT